VNIGTEILRGKGFILMQRKVFWLLFLSLGLIMDFGLPIYWSLGLTLPLAAFCWWVAYRSGWFE
jgi:hypothetical protein